MSVLSMKRVLVAGLRKDRKELLELLQRKGIMQISMDDIAEEAGAEGGVFHQADVSGARTTFEKSAQAATSALSVINSAVKDPNAVSMFSGRHRMSLTDYTTGLKKREKIMEMVGDINALAKRQSEIQAEIPKLEAQRESLTPWLTYDQDMGFTGTKSTRAFIGTLPNEVPLEDIYKGIDEVAPENSGVDVTIISSSSEQTCIQVVCLNKDAAKVEEALRHMSFARPVVTGADPKSQDASLMQQIERLNKEHAENEGKIASYAEHREEIKLISDYFQMRADKYDVIGRLYQTDKIFLLSGYVEERNAKALEDMLESRFDCVVEVKDPSPDEDVPVALKNNGYAAPVEGVVASYAMPGKGEIDPSFIAAIFYYFLFGMMLSDAAYGLIMVVGCAVILSKNKGKIEEGMRKTLTMFLYAGIGTMFWGIMFGSYFGDLPQVVMRTFFGKEIGSLALWVEPAVEPMTVLGFAFIVGIIHIFFGMGASAYTSIKQGKPLDALYDVGFWYLLLIGAIGILLTTDMVGGMFGLNLVLPDAVMTLLKAFAIIGAVGIILFGGRDSSNWGLRIGKGLYALYGISSYLSDILSYSRLLALGLATGVISSVFNSMAAMVAKPPVIGVILFLLIVVVGHTLNLAINALGAYVHTNRLEYVEFFGKFYNGGGRPFTPFTENTKHYKVLD